MFSLGKSTKTFIELSHLKTMSLLSKKKEKQPFKKYTEM